MSATTTVAYATGWPLSRSVTVPRMVCETVWADRVAQIDRNTGNRRSSLFMADSFADCYRKINLRIRLRQY